MNPVTGRTEETGLATDAGRGIGAITAAEVVRRIIEVGEMIPATEALEDAQMILLI